MVQWFHRAPATWIVVSVVGGLPFIGGIAAKEAHVPEFHAVVIKVLPHDARAFTQGLEYYGGYLYESTGIAGQSTIRKEDLERGRVVQIAHLPPQYFGEGLTIFKRKVYQLTWLSKTGFIYEVGSLRRIGEFHFEGEGWGLAHDDSSLIMSDGTNRIRFIDPISFAVQRTIEVYANGQAITNLNELEYIHGEIYANIWHSPRIARIDPRSGQVVAWIDLGAIAAKEQHGDEAVLNGIAYDEKRDRLFVTGKNWSKIFQIKLEHSPEKR